MLSNYSIVKHCRWDHKKFS